MVNEVIIKFPNGQEFEFVEGTDPVAAVKLISKEFPEAMVEKTFSEREQSELKRHEGMVQNNQGEHISYLDSEDNLTGGHGHLMNKEEQKKFPVGTAIPNKQVDKWFKVDTKIAEKDLNRILKNKNITELPDEAMQVLFNMSFNLGQPRLLGFKDMWSALGRKDFDEASKEMEKSRWFGQVKDRGVDLVGRMFALSNPSANLPGTKFNKGDTSNDETKRKN